MTQSLKLLREVLELAKMPPKVTVAEWAEEHRYLSSESSSKRGKWHSLPWQIGPMSDVTDSEVESITLMWASQVCGKTEVVNNVEGYHIDHEPCPILMLQPTVEMAESWSKERFTPMLRDTPRLRGKVRDARSRDANNTILHKAFPGGHLSIVGANAPAGLAMRPIRVLLCDEVDRYPKSAGVEGDPISLAEKRTESFWDAVKIYTSTPTVKGESRIEALFKETDQNYFWVPCPVPDCGKHQMLKWHQVKWPEGEPEKAYYECEHCRAHWNDEQRVSAIHNGEWRPSAPFKGKRGYHLNGIYVLFRAQRGFKNRLHQMAAKFLQAKAGGRETLKTWTNTFLAETWEDEGERPEMSSLMARAENYGPILPAGVLCLVAGADAQRDRLEALIIGIGLDWEIWCIQTARFMGSPEREEVWAALDNFLLQEFDHPSGTKMRIVQAFIDSGDKAEAVYRFCKRRHERGVYPIKGAPMPGQPLCGLPRKWGSMKVTGFLVGTDTAKGLIYDRFKIEKPGPRYIHFPIGFGFDEEAFAQLTAEKLSTEYRNGFPRRVWVKVRERNEQLDMLVYALAAGENRRPALSVLHKQLNPTKEEPKPQAAPAAEPQKVNPIPGRPGRPFARRGKGWVNNW